MIDHREVAANRERLDELELRLLRQMLKTGHRYSRAGISEWLDVSDHLVDLLIYRMRVQGYVQRSAINMTTYELVPLPEGI
jgi:hypothetical protein